MLSLTCLYTSQGCTTWVRCSTGIGGCPSPPPPKVYPTPPPQPYKCECGVRNKVLGKIVGGENADKGEFPWQVNLVHVNTLNQKSTRPFCGGILLSSDTVLTAAHCKEAGYSDDVSKFKVIIFYMFSKNIYAHFDNCIPRLLLEIMTPQIVTEKRRLHQRSGSSILTTTREHF